jgi:hypothetical protein
MSSGEGEKMINLTYENGRIQARYNGVVMTVEEVERCVAGNGSYIRVGVFVPFSVYDEACRIANSLESLVGGEPINHAVLMNGGNNLKTSEI